MLSTLSGRSFIKIQYSSFLLLPVAYPCCIAMHYSITCEKCKVNDVIFPSGCEARAINLSNKNMKICIFTGDTSVRLKNIFTDISRYPTGKHVIIMSLSFPAFNRMWSRYRYISAGQLKYYNSDQRAQGYTVGVGLSR